MISSLLTWEGWVSLLPALGSCLACAAYYMRHPLAIKLFLFPATALWLLYGIFVSNPPLILCNALGLAFLVVGIVRELASHKKESP